MFLPAISIGYAIPARNFEASVHSVFQSAMNLRLNKANRLLTLLAGGNADLPQGIRLDTPEGFSFEAFQQGEAAICRDGVLHFENKSLTIHLRGARRWKCDLPALRADASDPVVSTAWSIVWDALNRRQKLSNAEIIVEDLFRSDQAAQGGVARRAAAAMRDLVNATRLFKLTDASAVKALIGLGPGLTPSGDDLLVGYMAGLWSAVRDKRERGQFISSLGRTINRLSQQTNEISRTYLYHAIRGQVSSRLAKLAEAICRGKDPERLLEIAEAAMQVGHTSGMETVTGMLVGLAAWEGNRILPA